MPVYVAGGQDIIRNEGNTTNLTVIGNTADWCRSFYLTGDGAYTFQNLLFIGNTTTKSLDHEFSFGTGGIANIVSIFQHTSTNAVSSRQFFNNYGSTILELRLVNNSFNKTWGLVDQAQRCIQADGNDNGGVVVTYPTYSNGVNITYQPAAPLSGSYVTGDVVWNSIPTSGAPLGWVCTISGTPGTWNAMANLV